MQVPVCVWRGLWRINGAAAHGAQRTAAQDSITYGSGGRRVDLSLDGHAPAEVEEVELKHRIAEPALSHSAQP